MYYICTMYENPEGPRSTCPPLPTPMLEENPPTYTHTH